MRYYFQAHALLNYLPPTMPQIGGGRERPEERERGREREREREREGEREKDIDTYRERLWRMNGRVRAELI